MTEVVVVSGDARRRRPRYDEGCFLRNFVFLIFRTKPSQLVFQSRKHLDGHGCRFVSMKPFLRNSKPLLYDFSFEWVSLAELCKFRNRRIKTAVHVRSDCFSFSLSQHKQIIDLLEEVSNNCFT